MEIRSVKKSNTQRSINREIGKQTFDMYFVINCYDIGKNNGYEALIPYGFDFRKYNLIIFK